ncbi:MAG TPA: hypothetical protein VKB84_08640 [Candidatus Binataceae bacterium]|nr:hypothetical protein [Candidatus Binataceae bacterium]
MTVVGSIDAITSATVVAAAFVPLADLPNMPFFSFELHDFSANVRERKNTSYRIPPQSGIFGHGTVSRPLRD